MDNLIQNKSDMDNTIVFEGPGGNKGARSSKNATVALAGNDSNNSYAKNNIVKKIRLVEDDYEKNIRNLRSDLPWIEEDEVKVVGIGTKHSRFKTSNIVEIFEGITLKIKLLEGQHNYTIVKSKEDPSFLARFVLRDNPLLLSWYNARGILAVDDYKLKQNCIRIFKDGNVDRHVLDYMDHLLTFGPRNMMHVQKTEQVKNNDWFQFCAINTTFINVGVGALGAVDQWRVKKHKKKGQVQMMGFSNISKLTDILAHNETSEMLSKIQKAQESGELKKVSALLETAIKFSSNPSVASICDKINEDTNEGTINRLLGLFDGVLEKIMGVKQWTTDNPTLFKIILGLGLAMCLSIVVAAVGTITSGIITMVKAIVCLKTGRIPAVSLPAQCQAWSAAQSVVAILSMAGMASGINMSLPTCIQLGRFTSDIVGSVESVLPIWIDSACKYFGIEVPFSLSHLGQTPKFLTELLEFFKEDNLAVRVLQEDKIAMKCIQLHRDSLKFRPLFFERGGEFSSPYFQKLYKDLEEMFNSVIANGSLVHDRICPLFTWLKGDAGVGKSTLIQLILEAFSALAAADEEITNYDPRFKEKYSPKNMYPRIPGSEYWSGYRGQAFAVWNEVFSSVDVLSRKVTATELLVAIENTSCPVNMADLGSKGTTFFTSSVVIATSNEINFESIGLTCPGALARRVHFPMEVKRIGNLAPDYSNVDECWSFSLFKVENHENEQKLGISQFLPKTDTFVFSDLIKAMFQEYKARVSARDTKLKVAPDWIKIVGKTQMFRSSSYMYSDLIDQDPCDTDPMKLSNFRRRNAQSSLFSYQRFIDSLPFTPWKNKDGDLKEVVDMKYVIKDPIRYDMGWENAPDFVYTMLRTWMLDKFPGTFLYEALKMPTDGSGDLSNTQKMLISRVATGLDSIVEGSPLFNTDLHDRIEADLAAIFEQVSASTDVTPTLYEDKQFTYAVGNFDIRFCKDDIFVTDYAGRKRTLFDNCSFRMCVTEYVDEVIVKMCKAFREYTGWTFLEPSIVRAMGVGLCVGLGITALTGLGCGIALIVSKFMGSESATAGYLGEEMKEGSFVQSLIKDREMSQLPRKGVRIRYAKFQAGEEGMQRWINLMSNSRMITCRYAEGFSTMSNILFGNSTQAMIPLHMWECGTMRSIEIFSHDGTTSSSYSRSDFTVKLFPGYDKALLLFKMSITQGTLKDIRNQFPEQHVYQYAHTMRLMKGRDEDDKIRHYFKLFDNFVRSTSPLECESVTQDRYELTINDYFIGVNGEGAQGLCAYPIITIDPRYQSTPILGFHTAQVGNDSVITPISQKDWNYGSEFQFSVSFPCEEHFMMDKGYTFGTKGTSSAPRPVKGVGTASNTCFVKTPLYEYLPEPDFAPAVLKNVKPTPYSVFDAKYGKYSKEEYDPVISNILENQTSELFDGILPVAPKPGDLNSMLTFEEVIHGCPRYIIKSVDTSSSAGFPHNLNKDTKNTRDFINLETGFVDKRVEEMYNAKLARIDSGNLEMSVVQDNLKDELVTLEKVRIHKTRVFCGSELIERLVMKGICGKLVGWLKLHRATGPIQVGANVHNYEWRLIYDVIVRHGMDRRIGGDIAGMDVSTPHFVQRVMFLFFTYALNLRPGTVMYNRYRWVSMAVCSTVHVRGERAYLFCRGNSSGNWITTLVNSVMIWFYFSIIFLIVRPPDQEHHKFKDCVSLVIYGDDTGGGVSRKIEWYDNLVISKYMADLFGVDFTDPGKGQIQTRFLQTAPSFLCRSFNVVKSGAFVKAPLDWSSLSRLLYYYRHNPEVHTMEEAVRLNLDCFERELVHYDCAKRKEIISMVEAALEKCGFSYVFGTGDMWERRFIAGYVSCYDFLEY